MKALLEHIQKQQDFASAVADILQALQQIHHGGTVDRKTERQLIDVSVALALKCCDGLDVVNLPAVEGAE